MSEQTITFGSVCSGIEAASVAWEPLGMKPAWFSEIDTFPSAVLRYHWPYVTNLGDMTTIPERISSGEVAAPDVLVGGTPCQAFSVAGARQGLADERGALTIKFVEIADAIDRSRAEQGLPPAVITWENVPGVLTSKDNAFGAFLGLLAGEDCELQPPGKKWENSGCVFGPQRTVAWRILDAQYFGVAQRRRRVFVVASAADGFDPTAVLFEREGLRRDTAPSREAGQGAASNAASGTAAPGGSDRRVTVPILEPGARTGKSTTDKRAGMGIGSDGDPMFTLQAGKQHGVGCWWDGGQVSQTLDAVLHKGQTMPEKNRFPAVLQPAVFDVKQGLAPHGKPAESEISAPLKASDYKDPQLVRTVSLRGREGGATAELGGEVAGTLRASTGGGDKPHVLTVHGTQDPDIRHDQAHTIGRNQGQESACLVDMVVRRLTPIEAERLQGFPDNHTQIPWRKKGPEDCPDGPRYKAIGNSMAVPVMRWIGQRIISEVSK